MTVALTLVAGAVRLRVPFGSEWPNYTGSSCAECSTPRGQRHALACPIEECSMCLRPLTACVCRSRLERAA